MASLYDKAAELWNSNYFSTAPAAEELAAIGNETQKTINSTIRQLNRNNKIEESIAAALNFNNNNVPYMRPKARPLSFSNQLNVYSSKPTNAN